MCISNQCIDAITALSQDKHNTKQLNDHSWSVSSAGNHLPYSQTKQFQDMR